MTQPLSFLYSVKCYISEPHVGRSVKFYISETNIKFIKFVTRLEYTAFIKLKYTLYLNEHLLAHVR